MDEYSTLGGDGTPPVPPGSTSGLEAYWKRPVYELAQVENGEIGPEWAERHAIYSLLTMALIHRYWNGNKSGATGTYPWRETQKIGECRPSEDGSEVAASRYAGDQFGDRYIGHNIACIAVDENGEIIDFDFNHNDLYNSSAEHAENRLIRRIFSLNQLYDHWQSHAAGETRHVPYGDVFNGTTIYTSLESCAQCSGVMTLANALRVVFLQSDPGQYLVGNMLYNLTRKVDSATLAKTGFSRPKPKPKYFAPEPLDASRFGFRYKKLLDEAFQKFAVECLDETNDLYFYKGPEPGDKPKRTSGLTSFLCTDLALEIFRAADKDLQTMTLAFGDWRPDRSDGQPAGYTNAGALEHARAFLNHAVKEARRGTPHR